MSVPFYWNERNYVSSQHNALDLHVYVYSVHNVHQQFRFAKWHSNYQSNTSRSCHITKCITCHCCLSNKDKTKKHCLETCQPTLRYEWFSRIVSRTVLKRYKNYAEVMKIFYFLKLLIIVKINIWELFHCFVCIITCYHLLDSNKKQHFEMLNIFISLYFQKKTWLM